jgi:uncharacterized protein YjbI with pentapeptide repeats
MKRTKNKQSTLCLFSLSILKGLIWHNNKQNPHQSVQSSPPNNSRGESWIDYWRSQKQPWRTEPEIDSERKDFLNNCLSIIPSITLGKYPFSNIKLTRADIEWLLATHEKGYGPVNWDGERQRDRDGLDLRGADLSQLNLRRLPLARLHGWLIGDTEIGATEEQKEKAALHLEGADLRYAHLEGADLRYAHLEGADLRYVHLEGATLRHAHLEGGQIYIKSKNFTQNIPPADLRMAFFDDSTVLNDVVLGDIHLGWPQVADVRWGNANLSVVSWTQMKMLGDEYIARQKKFNGKMKDRKKRLEEFEVAVRANRQVSVILQAQGLNEPAAQYAYRAEVLQKRVLWLHIVEQHVTFRKRMQSLGALLLSWSLYLLAGYGYRSWRSFVAYLLVITAFATVYFIIGSTVGPALSPVSALVFSMTSFHGRGFFPGGIKLDDPLTIFAALEAFIGLLIEVTFIATLTQRLFSK